MLGRKIRLGVAVVALALGAGLGSGTAAATAAATANSAAQRAAAPTSGQAVMVLSDTITFSGVATPVPPPGSYTLTSNQCGLTSDQEPVVFPCTIGLKFSLATLLGTGQVNSPDGVVTAGYKLTPTGGGHFTLTGTCTTSARPCLETESEGGATYTYACDVSGALTITPIPGSPALKVTGKINVFEGPNAP
jgi:hypothetical protein